MRTWGHPPTATRHIVKAGDRRAVEQLHSLLTDCALLEINVNSTARDNDCFMYSLYECMTYARHRVSGDRAIRTAYSDEFMHQQLDDDQ